MTLASQAQPEEQAPPPDREQDQDWLFEQAKDRLAAANAAIGTTRTFFFALLSVAAYIGVVIAGTTDEQLLRTSPVKLPIIGVEVPLTGFYIFVPWLFVLLHFNLLIHLALTSRKLKAFLDRLKHLDQEVADGLRNDVANFPLAQWMVGKHDAEFRAVLAILVWITLVLIPPSLLVWMQGRFLSFQDQAYTWLQATAVVADVVLVIGFRNWFALQIEKDEAWIDRWDEGLSHWRKLRAPGATLVLNRIWILHRLELIVGGVALLMAVLLIISLRTGIIAPPFSLNMSEKLLTRNTLSPTVVNALRGDDAESRKKALSEILELNLRDRNLQGAVFYEAVLSKADLGGANLEGAVLSEANLEGADLYEANLEGAELIAGNLEGAKLRGANLRHAEAGWVKLNGADLWKADLEGANLENAHMENVILWGANLKDANMWRADLSDARFSMELVSGFSYEESTNGKVRIEREKEEYMRALEANLEGADLLEAKLTDADLRRVDLKGANLQKAQLQGANLTHAQLQNADLREAQLQGANLTHAQLQNADLRGILLRDADLLRAQLQGADLKLLPSTSQI